MSRGEGRLFRLFLRLLPSDFRDRFSREMAETFSARRGEARIKGPAAVLWLWARTSMDLVRTAAIEWGRVATAGDLRADVSLAVRSLSRAPLFTLLAGATIALGIGANTAVFSVVNAVLLRPLPVESPDELVRIYSKNDAVGEREYYLSPSNFLELRRTSRTLDDVAAWVASESTILVGPEEEPTRASILAVTWNLPELLGVEPLLGRNFAETDDDPDAPGGVLLPWGTWQRLFGGPSTLTSASIRFLGGEAPVLGVLPPGFDDVVPEADVVVILSGLSQDPARDDRWLSAVARTAPEVAPDAVTSELDALAASFADANPAANQGWGYEVDSVESVVLGEAKPALLILLGAAGLVLLIACANVANLMLSRAEARERDITLRAALGASRGRIGRLLITEAVLLSTMGAALGVALGHFGVGALTAIGSAEVPRLDQVTLDGRVLGFTTLLTVATGILFGLAPAARLARVQPAAVLRESARGSSGGAARERVRSAFVVGQLALSVLLVVSSGLLVRNFAEMLRTETGFERANVLTAEVSLNAGYPTYDDVRELYIQLADRSRSLTGVAAAGLSTSFPFSTNHDYRVPMQVRGRPALDVSQRPRAVNRMIDEGFLPALGIEVLQGRNFTALDDGDAEGVAIINEAAARTFFGGEDPIGSFFVGTAGPFGPLGEIQKSEVRVVGVVRDVRFDGLTDPAEPTVYFPMRQAPFRRMNLTLRTSNDASTVLAALRREVGVLDPSLPLSDMTTVEQLIDRSVAQERFSSTLLSVFAFLALALASVGIYGVLSHTVARRVNEIGIRRALGANADGVARLVLGKTIRLTAMGIGAGLLAALAAGRLLQSQLHTVDPRDPLILGGVAVALATIAFLASVAPLLRALAVDPAAALRTD